MTPTVKPSPLTECCNEWEKELEGDIDKHFLLNGVKYGFKIIDQDVSEDPVFCRNYKSATDPIISKDVEKQILEEIDNNRYIICNSPAKINSSLGALRKSSGGVRILHDCSRPHGASLNSYATTHKFKYQTVDRAMELLPRGGYMAKVDLSHAYRVAPIHPDCYAATGLHWTFDGDTSPTYMIDCRLPFGASKSPEIFQRLSNSVTRFMKKRGYTVIAYLDDFLVIEATEQRCSEAYNILLQLLEKLGFKINWKKAVPPSQQITFLGIDICSVTRQLSLPQEKLEEIRILLDSWEYKKKATKHELMQLVGKLNWAARLVRGGRTFLRRLINIMCSLKRKHHCICLTASARADIKWWLDFMQVFNCTMCFIHNTPVPAACFTSDACTTGGGATYNSDWFYVNWCKDYPGIAPEHINVKELCTIVLAARRWSHIWTNKHIVVYTDNTSSMYSLNKGTSRNEKCMSMLRELFWLSAIYNFHISSKHIPGVENVVSDYLSRLHEHDDWPCFIISNHLYIDDPLFHMSLPCFLYLQEEHNGTNCKLNVSSSSNQHLQIQQNLHMLQ